MAINLSKCGVARAHNPKVVGSNPAPATNLLLAISIPYG
jgi:hypothetical protein